MHSQYPFILAHAVLQIEVVKAGNAVLRVVHAQKFRFRKLALVLKRRVMRVQLPFRFHYHRLMNRAVPPLDYQKVRRVRPDIPPAFVLTLETADFELRQGIVAVIVGFQSEAFQVRHARNFFQETLFKFAVRAVGEIVERPLPAGMNVVLLPQSFQNRRVSEFRRKFAELARPLVVALVAVVGFDNFRGFLLRRIEDFRLVRYNFRREVYHVEQFRAGRNQFLPRLERAFFPERFPNVRFRLRFVITRTEIAYPVALIGDCLKDAPERVLPFVQFRHGRRSKTAVGNRVQPRRKYGGFASAFGVVDFRPVMLHIQVGGTDNRARRGLRRVCDVTGDVRRLRRERLIVHFQLIERNRRQIQNFRAVIAAQRDAFRAASFRVEFFDGSLLLLFQLAFQFLSVGFVQVNERGFVRVALHLSQTAARRLQDHIPGAVALLRENNARQTAAVPALFADLHKQYDSDFGRRFVQRVELHLTVGGLRILLVAFMEP